MRLYDGMTLSEDDGRKLRERVGAWKRDPAAMVRELFHAEPDVWQCDALAAFANTTDKIARRIAMQACVGPGKSAVLAWMGWNFLLCYDSEHGHPNGYAMSSSEDNLKDNLWKELGVWYEGCVLLQALFEKTSDKITSRAYPDTYWLKARTWSKTADAEAQGRTLSGLHARSILYLIDESGDIAPAVLRAAEQGMGNCAWGKIATAGNPTSQKGLLYAAAADQAHLWTVIRITGDPDDPKCFTRQDREWAADQIKQYGRDNPWVMACILGLFPPTSLNALLGADEVRTAMGRHLTIDQYETAQKRLGIDVARFGDDATVIFPRQGLAAFRPVQMRNARTNEIAARVGLAKSKWHSELELIDSTGGWASGVVDSCLLGGIALLEVNFSGKADDSRYFNKRSEMHFRAAEWVKAGGALPYVPEILREAIATTYYFHEGKMRVTEKEQVKKELQGHSPDYWDAFCCTFAITEMPTLEGMPGLLHQLVFGDGRSAKHDWEPFAGDRE